MSPFRFGRRCHFCHHRLDHHRRFMYGEHRQAAVDGRLDAIRQNEFADMQRSVELELGNVDPDDLREGAGETLDFERAQ